MAAQRLGLGVLHAQRLDDDDAAVFGFGRERMPQRQRADLLRQADGVAAVVRTERAAAAAEQIDARRAVTGGAGALLAVHFLAGAVDIRPVLDRMGAAAALGELPHHTAMNEIGARLEAENGVGHSDRTGLLAVKRGDLELHVTHPSSVSWLPAWPPQPSPLWAWALALSLWAQPPAAQALAVLAALALPLSARAHLL